MLDCSPFKLFFSIYHIGNNKNPPRTDEICWSLEIRYCGVSLYVYNKNKTLQNQTILRHSPPPKKGCVQIHIEHINWSDASAIVATCISCVGIVATLFVFVTFLCYNDTPVVKSSR